MYLVDTNIFLELLLKQPRWELCAEFFETCFEKRIPLLMSYFSLHSIEIAMVSKCLFKRAGEFLIEIELADNIHIYYSSLEDEKNTIKNCEETNLDFDDGLQYTLTKKFNCKGIVSFDYDFNNLDIRRFEPNDLLRK